MKHDSAAFNRQWNEDADQSAIMFFVSVDQKRGTRGSYRIIHHQWLPGEQDVVLARYSSESKDRSLDAMVGVLNRLLEAVQHQRELREDLEAK